ncbi:MAG: HAD family phosphatase [Sedimentisphaerales bacterium]|nr:HAD family phosphatase [Sedimentisphaerales bacterium]
MTEEIKAVIFDWGGVMIDDPGPGLMKYCAEKFKVTEDLFDKTFHKFLEYFQTNSVSDDKFWELICRELKKDKPSEVSLWKDAFRAVYKPREEMFSLADSLQKRDYKTAVLSNTELPALDFFIEQRYNCFDAQVFSCKEGVTKPNKKIYEITVKKLDCTPRQAVFIDDKKPMAEGAKNAGLNAILFESINQVKKELIKFGLDL